MLTVWQFHQHKFSYIRSLLHFHCTKMEFLIIQPVLNTAQSLFLSVRATYWFPVSHISIITGLLSFLAIIPLTALPLSVLLSGETRVHHRGLEESGLIPGQTLQTSCYLSSHTHLTLAVWCGLTATCRHAAFLYRTLGEPSFMRCSIMCVLSPDWVALKCKYLWNKAVVRVSTERDTVS